MLNNIVLLSASTKNGFGQWNIRTSFVLYMVAAVIVTIVILAWYLIIFRKDEKKRTEAILGFPLIIGAVFMMVFLIPIASGSHRMTQELNAHMSHDTDTVIYTATDSFEASEGDASFAEKAFIVVIDVITDSLVVIREKLYGTDMSLHNIIFEDSTKVLVNLDVIWSLPHGSPITVSVYDLIIGCSYLFLVIAFGRVPLQMLKSTVDEKEKIELRNQIQQLLLLPVLVIVAPGFVQTLWMVNGSLIRFIGYIDFSTLTIPEYSVFEDGFTGMNYGLAASVSRFVMFFIEFKIWFILLTRKLMLTGFYLMLPLAITVNAIGKEFDSLNLLLRQIFKYTFIPFFYAIAYIIVLMVSRGIPTGGNILVQLALYVAMFKVADALAAVFMLVSRGQDRPSGIGGETNNAGRIAMMGITAMLGGLAGKRGGKSGASHNEGSGSKGGSAAAGFLSTMKGTNTARKIGGGISKAASKAAESIGAKGQSFINSSPNLTGAQHIGRGIKQGASNAAKAVSNSPVGKALGEDVATIGNYAKSKGVTPKNIGKSMAKGTAKGALVAGASLVAAAATGDPMAGLMAGKGASNIAKFGSTRPVASSDQKNHKRR